MNWFGEKGTKVTCILDIESGSVGSALVDFNDINVNGEVIPNIIWTTREDDIDEALSKTVFNANEAGLVIDQVQVIFSPPWAISDVRTVSFTKKTPTLFSKEIIMDILNKEQRALELSLLKKGGKSSQASSTLIDQKIIEAKLNGYHSDNPFGKKAKSLDLTLFISIADSEFLQGTIDRLNDAMGKAKTTFHSFNYLSLSATHPIFAGKKNYASIYVRGSKTDIDIISNGSVAGHTSIPYGSEHITKDIAKALNSTTQIAGSTLSLFGDHLLEAPVAKQITEISKSFIENAMKDIASNLPKTTEPLEHFFVMTDERLLQFTERLLNEMRVGTFNLITPEAIRQMGGFKGKTQDSYLTLETLAINSLGQ